MRLLVLTLTLITLQLVCPESEAKVTVLSERAFELPDTIRFVLHSATLERDVVIDVTGPQKVPADPGLPSQVVLEHTLESKLPAIYALDGGLDVTAATARMLGFNFAMQPAYVIAISSTETWGPKQWAEREIDFLHLPIKRGARIAGGGGARFQIFLLNELRPFVEERFPVDPKRSVLVGHSLGGLFTATVLAQKPEAFSGYLIASPSLQQNPALLQDLQRLAASRSLPRVFVSVGAAEEPEMIENSRDVATALAVAGGSNVKFQVYNEQGHVPSYLAALPFALPFLLPP